MHVAAAMFTPASLIAAATRASAPGVLSMSITRSTAMSREPTPSRHGRACRRTRGANDRMRGCADACVPLLARAAVRRGRRALRRAAAGLPRRAGGGSAALVHALVERPARRRSLGRRTRATSIRGLVCRRRLGRARHAQRGRGSGAPGRSARLHRGARHERRRRSLPAAARDPRRPDAVGRLGRQAARRGVRDVRAAASRRGRRCRRRRGAAPPDGPRAGARVRPARRARAGAALAGPRDGATSSDMTPEAGAAAALVSDLCAWIDRLFPDVDRGERLKGALTDSFGSSDDDRAVTAELCREVETIAHGFSRHLALEYVADGSLVLDTQPPGWPPHDPRDVQLRAGSVGHVAGRADGVGVLALDGLDPVDIAAPYLEAAFALLRGARAVVLDLRRNGGGDPGAMTLVLDWLLGGEPTHISDVIYRDRARQWWTTGRLADRALPRETPLSVLVGEHTFSSGEALAYHVQSQRRGSIVGRATPGAADHVTPVAVSGHGRALLPEARVRDAVTGANWEGTGVLPDIACEPAEALTVAADAPGCGETPPAGR